jgi:hypothetical protein
VIRENLRLTVREVSEEAGISKSSSHTILTEKLEMHHVPAKFVPRLLINEQKANCVMASQELLDCSNADENLLKNVITVDEMWVYECDIETKAQSSPRPKQAHQSRSNVKVLLIFFYGKGVVHHEFVPRGQTVNGQFYLEVTKRSREAEQSKRPKGWINKSWMLHHNNAPAHMSLFVSEFLVKYETTVVPQLLYFPDFTPANFVLFPRLKSTLKGCRFQTIEEIEENSPWDLSAIPQIAFQNWKKRWKRCIEVERSNLKETSLIKL